MSFNFLLGILFLNILVLIHELGHYLFARYYKIGVQTFAIGIGPVLYSYKDSLGTNWQFSAIPLLGYVEPKTEESSSDVVGEIFIEAPIVHKILVAFAGPLFNFIKAYCLILAVVFFCGKPVILNKVLYVADKSSAQNAQIMADDYIISVNNQDFDIKLLSIANPILLIKRGDSLKEVQLSKRTNELSGIKFVMDYEKISFVQRFFYPLIYVANNIVLTIGNFFKALLSMNFMSFIGIADAIGKNSQFDLPNFLMMLANISISLGAINLIPIIPALDGGQILLFLIFWFRRKKLSKTAEVAMNYFSVAFILLFSLIGLLLDVKRLFL